jgi:hypothetical protein
LEQNLLQKMLNKKGNLGEIALIVLIAGMLFGAGMLFVNPLKESVDTFRTDFGCYSRGLPDTTISDGAKVTCLAADLANPYFILLVISTAGGLIITKFAI